MGLALTIQVLEVLRVDSIILTPCILILTPLQTGDILEVVDKTEQDGWWKVRLTHLTSDL